MSWFPKSKSFVCKTVVATTHGGWCRHIVVVTIPDCGGHRWNMALERHNGAIGRGLAHIVGHPVLEMHPGIGVMEC